MVGEPIRIHCVVRRNQMILVVHMQQAAVVLCDGIAKQRYFCVWTDVEVSGHFVQRECVEIFLFQVRCEPAKIQGVFDTST